MKGLSRYKIRKGYTFCVSQLVQYLYYFTRKEQPYVYNIVIVSSCTLVTSFDHMWASLARGRTTVIGKSCIKSNGWCAIWPHQHSPPPHQKDPKHYTINNIIATGTCKHNLLAMPYVSQFISNSSHTHQSHSQVTSKNWDRDWERGYIHPMHLIN